MVGFKIWRQNPNKKRHTTIPGALKGEREIDYFLAHGVFPPTVAESVTPEGLIGQITETQRLAETSTDLSEATRFVHELGYLTQIGVQLGIEQLKID